MNDLTLENLSVNFKAGTIDFPQAGELKKLVASKLEQTKGLVATDESIKATKASRAEVNKLKKAIGDVRKEYKTAWNAPFELFESTLRGLEKDCDEASQELKLTIDGFEETQREERKQKVQALIEEMAPNYGVKPEDLPIADKWLLKSTSQKTITQEIGEQMKTLVNLYKERDEIVKKCIKSGLAPAPYIEMHENGTSYIDVSNKVAEQKATMMDIGDGRLVDENGEIKQELQLVTFTLKGTKEQLDNVARFCITNGVKVVKASEREEVIE
ncbi:DUF1351 domain-containing protein [Ligilactobacillus ruminis]|uniref:DUF1351 domain-containing protein n=1 Tax=Ligilactobacillus ruminis TaxID=1623 RepID=UPI0034A2CF8A